MIKEKWILCPVCGNKTRDKVREDTELKNFPLFCPKCKQETIINVEQMNIIVTMIPPMAKAAGVTEQLKATEQMQWVGLMNAVKAQVEEIIFAELIYC